jgi:hypothetical protein
MRVVAMSFGVLLVLSEHKYDRSIRISRTKPTGGSEKSGKLINGRVQQNKRRCIRTYTALFLIRPGSQPIRCECKIPSS